MKDMYSFDLNEDSAMATYNNVRDAYDWFFSRIGLPFVTVFSLTAELIKGQCRGREYWRITVS